LVAVFPSLLVYSLQAEGLISSAVLSVLLAALLSLAVCQIAGLYWERRASEDVLFGDLMIWGWARRRLIERRLASAVALFGAVPTQTPRAPIAVDVEQRMRVLQRLAADLEASDPYTHGHSRRVARYASMIASQMGLSKLEVAEIRAAAALHDVGKINTPIEILHKPDRLTDEEFAVVKRHPVDGAQMISVRVKDEKLASIVRHHHERLDGTGYPSRLTAAEIPLGARIIAVADTFDAITSKRPYRSAKPHKAAFDILRAEAGDKLDPDAVQALGRVYFARRPISALVALANLTDRVFSGLLGGVLNAARVAGIAAVTAGLGSAALPSSGWAHRSAPQTPRLSAAAPGRSVASDFSHAHNRSHDSSPCCELRGRVRRQSSGPRAPVKTTTRPLSNSNHPPLTSPPHAPATGAGGSSDGASSHPTPPNSGPVVVTVNVPAGSGSPSVSATLRPENPGSPGISTSVTAQGSQTSSASASVTAAESQTPRVSATVTLPGSPTPSGVQIGNQ